MSNRPENVPIATLAGMAPLTDVLRKIPLPRLKEDKNTQSLVHPSYAQNAKAVIQSPNINPDVVQRVASTLAQVNTGYLKFKNPSQGEALKWHQKADKLPPVFLELMKKNPKLFSPTVEVYGFPHQATTGMRQSVLQMSPQKHGGPGHVGESPRGKSSKQSVGKIHMTSPLKSVQHDSLQIRPSPSKQISKPVQSQKSPAIGVEQVTPKVLPSPAQPPPPLVKQLEPSPLQKLQETIMQTHADPTKSQDTAEERQEMLPVSNDEKINEESFISHSPLKSSQERAKHRGGHQSYLGIKVFTTRQSSKNKRSEDTAISRVSDTKDTSVKQKSDKKHVIEKQGGYHDEEIVNDVQPPIPKLVLKRTTKRLGSREFETHEIVSAYNKSKEIEQLLQPPVVEEKETEQLLHRPVVEAPVLEDKESIDESRLTRSRQVKRRVSDIESTGTSVGSNGDSEGLSSKRQKSDESDEDFYGEEFETGDGKRFTKALKKLLEYELRLEEDGHLDFGDDVEIPEDSLIPRPLITDTCMELSKIKRLPQWKDFPMDKIVAVIAVMDRHVREGMQLLLSQAQEEAEEEERLWRSLTIEKHLRASEAALVILHFTTAPDVPKQVFVEEAIEHVVSFCKFQLENTIYPEVDPVYRVGSDRGESTFAPKSRRARGSASSRSKSIMQLYNKLCEMTGLLSDLVSKENLTDTIILQVSTLGTMPFFVENVSVLQLEALKLVRNIFRRYVKHRDLILDDLLASLAKLPSSKRNLRSYRLYDDISVQMMTALVLQLVQCTVKLPSGKTGEKEDEKDPDVLIVTSYEDALRAAQNFLSVFLKKCGSVGRDESDFRPLFENFLQDLLVMLNKAEWPAAETVLTLLGRLLIVTFNNKSNEMPLRVASMDYLALIATHLRKDAVQSIENDQDEIHDILKKIIAESNEPLKETELNNEEAHNKHLQKSLLTFLSVNSQNDESLKFAREFYLAQWFRDVHVELEKCVRAPMMSIPGAASNEMPTECADTSVENIKHLEDCKKYYHDLVTRRITNAWKSQQTLTAYEARVVARHLASSRAFSQSFDIYLQQIFKILNEPAIALRAKAVKSLTQIVSVDPTILAREDVQASVHARFLDQSTNVREAAVDLIGQFVLKCPDLMDRYYEMISERILDTGISVRKRVIKILKDICIELPEYPKIPEIYVKMIRRINDEEGIRELVTKVFQKMWFSVVTSTETDSLLQRAHNITKVVSLSKDTGHEWFENLLESIFDVDDDASKKAILKACQQLLDCLVEKLLKSEEQSGSNTAVSCLTTLYLISKVQPQFLIQHAPTLQPYLSIKCNTPSDTLIIQNVARILELVVPLMEHPNPKFLADLEEDLMKLILRQGQNVVQSCISCLAAIVNVVTHNYKFVMDCFQKFFVFLSKVKQHFQTTKGSQLASSRASLLRSLFTVGLLCKHFDVDAQLQGENTKETTSEKVFSICLHFASHGDEEICLKAIMAAGFVGVRCPDLLLRHDAKVLYKEALSPEFSSSKRSCTILKSLQNHLMEEETRSRRAEETGKKGKKKKTDDKGNLKEFGDAHSGSTSAVMQVLLKDILETFLHPEQMVRLAALQVVCLILRQGLIHPAQCVPYLVCIASDDDQVVRAKAEQCLSDIDSRHGGFIHMKALQGVKLSYKLQKVVQHVESGYLRGYRQLENRQAMVSHVYTLLRSSKQYRRPFLMSLLKLIDSSESPKDLIIYMIENLAYLPYVTQEEPLFVIHQVDTVASVTGSHLLQTFKEIMSSTQRPTDNCKEGKAMFDEEDDDDVDKVEDWDIDTKKINETIQSSFGCLLLLELKQHLKQLYGFADSKCQKYSPSEPSKLFDKSLTRKGDSDFNPQCVSTMFREGDLTKEEMFSFFVMFKQFMLTLDNEDESDTEVNLDGRPSTADAKSADKSANANEGNTSMVPVADVSHPVSTFETTETQREEPPPDTQPPADCDKIISRKEADEKDNTVEEENVSRRPKRKRSMRSSNYGSD